MSNGLPPVTIVGGGIGGLTCAIALADFGIESIVLERYAGANDVGAGIQISPNATRVLYRLGLQDDLSAFSRKPSAMVWLDGNTDRRLAQFQILEHVNATYDAPYLQIYRPDLMQVLESKCRDDARIDLRKGAEVQAIQRSASEITLETTTDVFRTNVCIGADGTNSTIRNHTNDSFENRIFAGYAYRAAIPLNQLDEHYALNETTLWLNSTFHVVSYVVGEEPLLNCVFVVESEDVNWFQDLHRQTSSLRTLTDALANPSPRLQTLLSRVPDGTLYRWPLFQFPPIPVRIDHEFPVALMGDAWHTTLPFAGQGAALAIEDAMALAQCLSEVGPNSIVDSLTRYEDLRISRIRQVQAISARNRNVYHVKNPFLKLLRSSVAQIAYRRTTHRLFSYEGIEYN